MSDSSSPIPLAQARIRPQPATILLRMHGALLGVTLWGAVGVGFNPLAARAAAILIACGIILSAPYWLLRDGRRVTMVILALAAAGGAAVVLPLCVRGELRAPVALFMLASLQTLALAVMAVAAGLGVRPGWMEALGVGSACGSTLLAYCLESRDPTPPVHYLVGGASQDDQMLYRVQPYSTLVQFYPTNPRDYFTNCETRRARHWYAWNLRSNPDSDGHGRAYIVPGEEGLVRLKLTPATAAPQASFCWHCDNWQCKSGRDARLKFRARCNSPGTMELTIGSRNDSSQVMHRLELEVSTTWQTFHVELMPYEGDDRPSIAVVPPDDAKTVELANFCFSSVGQELSVAAPLTPYLVEYQMNALGFRDRDFVVPRPSDVFRIVCLGDSFTWGQGVHVQDTYPKVLESLLARPEEMRRRVEIINCGRSGYHCGNERVCYEQEASRYQPQLVVLQVYQNDFVLDRSVECAFPGSEELDAGADDYRRCIGEIERLSNRCQADSAQLIVVLFRMGVKDMDWLRFLSRFENSTQLKDVPLLDLGDALARGAGRRDIEVHSSDSHANEVGHRLAAERLRQFLSERRLAPPDGPD